jgi:5-methylcytosine-specific restriction enzyme subunit McrC
MTDWKVVPQCKGQYLFTEPKMFLLKPDVYLEKDEKVILLDTKWKVLFDDRRQNFGISQADMYQMYAYYNRYSKVKRVVLVYPKPNGNVPNLDCKIDNDVIVSARFVEYADKGFVVSNLVEEMRKTVQNSQNTQNDVNL